MKELLIACTVILFLVGFGAVADIGYMYGEYVGATIAVVAWFLIWFFLIKIFKRKKQIKAQKLEKKADEVIDYARKSAAYHNKPDSTTDYHEHLKRIDDEEMNNDLGKMQQTIPAKETEVPPSPDLTDEEILAEYSDEFTKESPAIDILLKKIFNRKTLPGILKSAIPLILVFCLIVWLSNGKNAPFMTILTTIADFIKFAVLMLVLYFVVLKYMPNDISHDSIIYKKMIPQEIAKHFGKQSSYEAPYGLPDKEIMRFNCFKKEFSNISGKNLICGKYKNVDFRVAYQTLQREHTYTDSEGKDCTGYENIFKGIFVSLPFPKTSAYPLGLYSNSKSEITESYKTEGRTKKHIDGKINGTESSDFNTLFTINSEDEKNLYYILTPETMEKLAALYMHVYGPKDNTHRGPYSFMSSAFNGIYVFFDKNIIYIGLSSDYGFFSFSRTEPTAEGLKSLRKKINTTIIIIERILDFALSLY
ncbi:MAG: DUF3137 domain-containing protein [Wujia sp.]